MVVKSSDDVSNIPDDLGLLMIESHSAHRHDEFSSHEILSHFFESAEEALQVLGAWADVVCGSSNLD